MQREIVHPTPLHAADLQFQAFAEFDASNALANISCPTLLLTGEIDELISPQNSRMMVKRIRDAELIVIPGCGHRVIWEATDECTSIVSRFLLRIENGSAMETDRHINGSKVPTLLEAAWPALDMFTRWPLIATEAAIDSLAIARQTILANGSPRFGDGKPIILLPQDLGSGLNASMLTAWLKAIGCRPVIAHHADLLTERQFSQLLNGITQRLHRKAVLITGVTSLAPALDGAKLHPEMISDIVVLGSPGNTDIPRDVRLHFISLGWLPLLTLTTLPSLLRNIPIELLDQ
jgi:hypothetical protein